MSPEQAKIGTRVRSLVDFSGVPKGTEGTISSDYETGVMVDWHFPDGHHLRDGFNKQRELHFLEIVK